MANNTYRWGSNPSRVMQPADCCHVPFDVDRRKSMRSFISALTAHCTLHTCTPAGTYALQQVHFARLLVADRQTADAIFDAIFDTDANGLVDAFEAM